MTEAESLLRRVRQARFDLDFVCTQAEKNYVYWLEKRGKGMFLRASPIDVSSLLQEKLFDKLETVVLTSATLSTNGKFDFIKDRLGLETKKPTRCSRRRRSIIKNKRSFILPKAMPEPRSPEFTQMAANEIVKLLQVTNGRAFVFRRAILR
jgi:ATP-dependent DNA helicase DinG